jgi:hypothetical protein
MPTAARIAKQPATLLQPPPPLSLPVPQPSSTSSSECLTMDPTTELESTANVLRLCYNGEQ